jgi:hypothetical protein
MKKIRETREQGRTRHKMIPRFIVLTSQSCGVKVQEEATLERKSPGHTVQRNQSGRARIDICATRISAGRYAGSMRALENVLRMTTGERCTARQGVNGRVLREKEMMEGRRHVWM